MGIMITEHQLRVTRVSSAQLMMEEARGCARVTEQIKPVLSQLISVLFQHRRVLGTQSPWLG